MQNLTLFGHFMMPKNDAILKVINHPMMKALMNFTFPDVEDSVWKAIEECTIHS
jgi:hypothetical protein